MIAGSTFALVGEYGGVLYVRCGACVDSDFLKAGDVERKRVASLLPRSPVTSSSLDEELWLRVSVAIRARHAALGEDAAVALQLCGNTAPGDCDCSGEPVWT